jgi:hypothetical protein
MNGKDFIDYYNVEEQIYEYKEGNYEIKVKITPLPEVKIFVNDKYIMSFDITYFYIKYQRHFEYIHELDEFEKYTSVFFKWLKSNDDKSHVEVIAYAIATCYRIFNNFASKWQQDRYSKIMNVFYKNLPDRIKTLMLIYDF